MLTRLTWKVGRVFLFISLYLYLPSNCISPFHLPLASSHSLNLAGNQNIPVSPRCWVIIEGQRAIERLRERDVDTWWITQQRKMETVKFRGFRGGREGVETSRMMVSWLCLLLLSLFYETLQLRLCFLIQRWHTPDHDHCQACDEFVISITPPSHFHSTHHSPRQQLLLHSFGLFFLQRSCTFFFPPIY